MKNNKKGIIERLCQYLGRQNFASDFLDYFAGRMFSTPAFAYGGLGEMPTTARQKNNIKDILPAAKPILMARPPSGAANFRGDAPTRPHNSHEQPSPDVTYIPWLGPVIHAMRKAKAAHASKACSEPLYRGMHGAPCKFEGGSDNKCPKGTVSGWWWSYEVKGKGRIYYVDCCGGTPKHTVFCNWSAEPNWCSGLGKAQAAGIFQYNCTLAISEADMKVKQVGSNYEVEGVDP